MRSESASTHQNALGSRGTDTSLERRALRTLILRQEITLAFVILAVGIFAFTSNPRFLLEANLLEIFRGAVIYFLMASGSALLIIGGGLDFSVGAVFTLSALTGGSLMVNGIPWGIAVLAALALGILVGAFNHAVITWFGVPPIIATLGTFFIVGGVNLLITDGADVLPLPDSFEALGQGFIARVPILVIIGILTGIVAWVVLEWMRFGVRVRAVGGNRSAAAGNGIRVGRIGVALYCTSAGTAALAGLAYSARVGAGQVQAGGAPMTLVVVTAVLVGGVSLYGGLGSIGGVALGCVLLALVDNAIIVARIPPQYNGIVVGSILLLAVGLDHVRRREIFKRR